jgi:hypothetical protein
LNCKENYSTDADVKEAKEEEEQLRKSYENQKFISDIDTVRSIQITRRKMFEEETKDIRRKWQRDK